MLLCRQTSLEVYSCRIQLRSSINPSFNSYNIIKIFFRGFIVRNILNLVKGLFSLLEKYRWYIFILIYFTGLLFYKYICKSDWLPSFYHAAALFTINIKTDSPSLTDNSLTWLYIIGLIAALYTITSLISLVAKQFVDHSLIWVIKQKPYILVCGLGSKGSFYIESELASGEHQIIAIEKNPINPNIEKFRNQGIAVIVGNAKEKELLKSLNIKQVIHIVSLAGEDMTNMEISLSLQDVLKKKNIKEKKLFMHMENQKIDIFHQDRKIFKHTKLHIEMFSMTEHAVAEYAAKTLFLTHAIEGMDAKKIDSNMDFSIVVVGNSKLAIEVIKQICELGHFPNENRINIYCIGSDIENLKQTILFHYPNIDRIGNIYLTYIKLDTESTEFYQDKVWKKDIVNVVLCNDSAEKNLDIALKLIDNTYLHTIHNKSMKTKIHIAIYENDLIAKYINKNDEYFKYFSTFAQTSKMLSREAIVESKFDLIAKCICFPTDHIYNPMETYSDLDKIEHHWYSQATLIQRTSSQAEAYHIPVKLKALGLTYKNVTNLDKASLLKRNKLFLQKGEFGEELKFLGLDDVTLQNMTQKYADWFIFEKEFKYFPAEFTLLIEKLTRAEHNRWISHYYLMGWEYSSEMTQKDLRQHQFLLPLEHMTDEQKFSILYDIYAILYIPNLLAKAGYEIVKLEDA